MAQIRVTLRGRPKDHVLMSPELGDDELEEQLRTYSDALGTDEIIRLPWITTTGADVIAAERIEHSGPVSVRVPSIFEQEW
jgi:hypothetical protein